MSEIGLLVIAALVAFAIVYCVVFAYHLYKVPYQIHLEDVARAEAAERRLQEAERLLRGIRAFVNEPNVVAVGPSAMLGLCQMTRGDAVTRIDAFLQHKEPGNG